MKGRIFLWGPMGAGKSAVGRALATQLCRPFVDVDAAIETASGRTIADLFASIGERAFRVLERDRIEAMLAAPGDEIVALGGGALLDPVTRLAVLRAGLVVTLTAPAEELVARIGDPSTRPLLGAEGASPTEALSRLLRARAQAYAACHLIVDTSGQSVESVTGRLCSALEAGVVPVTISSDVAYALRRADSYAARATADAIRPLGASRVAIVTDDNVARLHLDRFVADLATEGVTVSAAIPLAHGEDRKTLSAIEIVLAELAKAECDRHSVVIGLGGGVVTDMAGLAASLFMRGVRWVAVPTTVLGMVDAAIGGKTGVNLPQAKNAVGSFHHPAAVIIDTAFSETESSRAVMSGLAEVVKVAAVRDAAFFHALETDRHELRERDDKALGRAVDGAIRLKAGVVSEDPSERGVRAVLNFGHTLGHALEAASTYGTFAHGEAVAIGMVAAARAGSELGLSQPEVAPRLVSLLTSLGLPVEVPTAILDAALELLRHDKKRRGDNVTLVLPDVLGSALLRPVSVELCAAAYRRTVGGSPSVGR
ncbi:MAG: 3-dehydroquinate synthase [Myxococcales bacterium]|nr:3-dehydroquinate synthase [Myxococcales bacterium]